MYKITLANALKVRVIAPCRLAAEFGQVVGKSWSHNAHWSLIIKNRILLATPWRELPIEPSVKSAPIMGRFELVKRDVKLTASMVYRKIGNCAWRSTKMPVTMLAKLRVPSPTKWRKPLKVNAGIRCLGLLTLIWAVRRKIR